jgi:1,4-dihydroxy-2-naphthoate octaprenyltransferase
MLLGAGIARYLNNQIDWPVFWLGLAWVITIQLGAQYLHEYFDLYAQADPESQTWNFGGSQVLGTGEGKLPRRIALTASMTALTTAGVFSIMLTRSAELNASTILMMVLLFACALGYSLPPMRLSRSGYGELVLGLIFGFLIPAFSFVLQAEETHRLVIMVGVPLIFVIVPVLLALTFPTYSFDRKHNRMNMLQRIGWQNSMVVHNSLILFAYLSLGVSMLLGFPRAIGMNVFMSIPLALAQIWLMARVAGGAKPSWNAIRFNGISMIGLMVFLFTFSFWTR